MQVKVVVEDSNMRPERGTEGSAGLDLKVQTDMVLNPGKVLKVGTGVKVQIPEGYVGLVFPRSSTGGLKIGLANTVGVIDSDYTGEIILKLENRGFEAQFLSQYSRVAQIVIVPYLKADLVYVKDLDETERGEGGFGSTN